jgi:hypothetical protein
MKNETYSLALIFKFCNEYYVSSCLHLLFKHIFFILVDILITGTYVPVKYMCNLLFSTEQE